MKTKIFVAYHKNADLIENEILTPIHVGRAESESEWLKANMIGDDFGDNISRKNSRYSELTAQYFVWKNYDKVGNPDYVGFLHYRRLLNFNREESFIFNKKREIEYNTGAVEKDFYEKFGLDEKNIEQVIDGYDIILPKPVDLKKLDNKNVYEHYAYHHKIRDYNIALKVLLEKYPEFREAVEIYNKSYLAYFTNSFIMKKELFKQYEEWQFSILFEVEKLIPPKKNTKDRLMGYISERLLGIYITYLKHKNYRIKELYSVFIDKAIPIVFSTNNNYALHLCCTLTSILKNANPEDRFKFYILNTKKRLNYINKKLISSFAGPEAQVIYVTLDNKADMFKNMPLTEFCSHITVETYYRLILADLFPQYDKLIYLDCDTNVLSSLFALYCTDISQYYCAGVEDILAEDSEKRLGLKKYINAGVLLINLKKWREDNIQTKFFNYIKENFDKIVWGDQDVLNVVLQNGIKYIDKRWNAQVGEYEHCYTTGFNKIGENAFILHYIGNNKPWMPLSKNPFKKVYMKYLHKAGWECSVVKYSIFCVRYYIGISITIFSNFRKFIIRYDRHNKRFVFLKKFSI